MRRPFIVPHTQRDAALKFQFKIQLFVLLELSNHSCKNSRLINSVVSALKYLIDI